MFTKLFLAPLVLGLGLAGTVATAATASAATCTWLDYAYVDSGVSAASGDLYRCSDGGSTWYTVNGRLYDTSCDDRTAYLDLHAEGQGGTTRSVSVCRRSVAYSASWPSPVYGVELRTRACNFSCSSQDDEWMYP